MPPSSPGLLGRAVLIWLSLMIVACGADEESDARSAGESSGSTANQAPQAEPLRSPDELIEALGRKSVAGQMNAASELRAWGDDVYYPALVEALKHENPRVRDLATRELSGARGRWAELAVPALIQRLKDENYEERGIPSAAAWSLGKIGSEAAAAVPALQELGGETARRAIERIRGIDGDK